MKIVTFGEIMMRLQPYGYKRFAQAEGFELFFGGGEANVAVSLAGFGLNAAYLSKLPDNALADACVSRLKGLGVDTSFIARGGDRMGIYFCEKGASQRPSKIIYDRKDSAINQLTKADIDVDALFSDTAWFHYSGITAALSDCTLSLLRLLLREAKDRGVLVSCDLNYRKKLWSREKAGAVMSSLMEYTDVLISNEEECKDIFGLEASGTDIRGGKVDAEGYSVLSGRLLERFKNLKTAAFTLRSSISASVNLWAGVLTEGKKSFKSREYTVDIVDRVGAGDSFVAGLIYSKINGKAPSYAVEFAAAASCLKHTVEGDFNCVGVSEVEALMAGDGSGRVQR